jgi:hypothetical protein
LVLKDKGPYSGPLPNCLTPWSAYLWTDGRYFLQAGEQLDKNWTLMKRGEKDVPLWTDFVAEKLPSGTKVGIDASTVSATDSKDILGKLKAPSKLIPFINQNLVGTSLMVASMPNQRRADRRDLDRPASTAR